jgi:hypothetical protein
MIFAVQDAAIYAKKFTGFRNWLGGSTEFSAPVWAIVCRIKG